jgi:hypothetical protein
MVQVWTLQTLVSIVVDLQLTASKGDFIGEIVKGSFRVSFLKQLSPWAQLAYRIKYKEYEKTVSLKVGFAGTLSDQLRGRVMVYSG